MKATLVNKEKNDVTFSMVFSADDFEAAIDKAYKATKGRYLVDGFRKGKAPRKIIEARYGEDVFFEDAFNDMFGDGYPVAVDELELSPVDRPYVDFNEFEKGKDIEMTIKVTVKPVVEVKDYKGVKVDKIDTAVTEEDIDADIEAMQKRNSRMVVVDRPAQDGDTVLIDYAGFVGDEQFEGGTAERQPLTLGSNAFIPGFEEQLVGVKTGEEKDVKVTFPEEYHAEDLAGKEAVFKVTVHEIKETELPEVNDDFVKDVSEFDTVEELRKDTREKLEKAAESKAEYDTKNAVLEKVYEATEVEIPDVMVEDQISQMVEEFDQQLKYSNMTLETYLGYMQKEMKDFREELRKDAHKRVKTRLVVQAVADAENIEPTDEEVEKELEAMAAQYQMEPDKLRAALGPDNFEYLLQDIKMRKAVDFMFENAVIE